MERACYDNDTMGYWTLPSKEGAASLGAYKTGHKEEYLREGIQESAGSGPRSIQSPELVSSSCHIPQARKISGGFIYP